MDFDDFLASRNDELDNGAYNLLCTLQGLDPERDNNAVYPWNMQHIGELEDATEKVLRDFGRPVCHPYYAGDEQVPCYLAGDCAMEICPFTGKKPLAAEKTVRTVAQPNLKELRARFPKGARVRLVKMDDIQAPPIGAEGTVDAVDDVGTIHVRWDIGGSLGVAYGHDVCIRIDESEIDADVLLKMALRSGYFFTMRGVIGHLRKNGSRTIDKFLFLYKLKNTDAYNDAAEAVLLTEARTKANFDFMEEKKSTVPGYK